MSFLIRSLPEESPTVTPTPLEGRPQMNLPAAAASRAVRTLRAGLVLSLFALAVPPARLAAQCTLASSPVAFEPNPPGVPRPSSLSSSFSTALLLYHSGAGAPRLMMFESFGYSILDLTNPTSPAALKYDDLRLDPNTGTTNTIAEHGDGQSYIQTIAVSPDGQRVAFSMFGPGDQWYTLAGRSDGQSGFGMWGSFPPNRALGTVVQQSGSRYIAYDVAGSSHLTAADITTLPTKNSDFHPLNIPYETTALPAGYGLLLVGNYLVYQTTAGIAIFDASNPGSPGSITSAYKFTTIANLNPVDPYSRTPLNYTAALDPADPTKLWVLVELQAATGEKAPTYGLVSVTKDGNGNLTAAVSPGLFPVPWQTGETWTPAGTSASLVASNGTLFAVMWARRQSPSVEYVLYSTTAPAWPSVNVPGTVVSASGFGLAATAAGALAGSGTAVYQYFPTGSSAFVIPLTCQPLNAPAFSSLTVTNTSAGTALSSGGTAFLGDTLSIVPQVAPAPSYKAVTWAFDFDFHPGNLIVEDNGTSPRIKNPDDGASGASSLNTEILTGPCDPKASGQPANGTSCWASVQNNYAEGPASGGPDYTTASPVAGSTNTLSFAFEATNEYGILNTAVFNVNWVVPAAKVASTQTLSGAPLVSASDGHPTGFKWYFGTSPTGLTLDSSCNVASCVPTTSPVAGTYDYWLTATYANGFVTPDYDGVHANTFTVTNFVPVFTVNGNASGPVTAYIGQNLTISNGSQRGSGITGTYYYDLCSGSGCSASTYSGVWGTQMSDPANNSGTPPSSATIPVPSTQGTYLLRFKITYSGGTAYWPDPTGASGFTINVSNAPPPIVVTVGVSPNPANSGTTVQFTCSATGGTGTFNSFAWSTTAGTFSSNPNPTLPVTNGGSSPVSYPATCTVTDSGGYQGSNSVSLTVNPGATQTPLYANASVSPNPAAPSSSVTFSCSASGGTPGYSYQWTDSLGHPLSPSPSFSFATPSTPGTIPATCTVTDSAQRTATSTANLTVSSSVLPPGPACPSVDFAVYASDGTQLVSTVSPFGSTLPMNASFGDLLAFSIKSGSISSQFDWTFGDGSPDKIGPMSDPTVTFARHAYTAGGTFTVTLKPMYVDNSGFCGGTSYQIKVSGPTGQFSAAYEDASPITYALVTAYKNIVFTAADAPGSVDSYAWDFGDGGTASGPTAMHAYSPGTWTAKLTVTKSGVPVSSTLAVVVPAPPEPPKWVVPGMAYVLGQVPGTTWQSDVTVLNPHPTLAATYSIAFLDARNPVTDYSQLTWFTYNVPPLGFIDSSNLLAGQPFLQPLGAYGALIVRGDSAPLPPVITARTFNNETSQGQGTFGLSVPPSSVSGGVSTQGAPAASVLIGLRQSAAAYTNIGLVNLHNDWATVELDFFDKGAAPLGTLTVQVNPYQSYQINKALADSRLVPAAGYTGTSDLYSVQVKILEGTGVYPYATVIDAGTTDPIVVTPAASPSNTYRLPGIVRLTGANGELFRSRVTVSNPSSAGRKVHMVLSFQACNGTGCSTQISIPGDVAFAPGQTQSWDDFVNVWLTVKGNGLIAVDDATSYQNSFLDISPSVGDADSDPLVVLGETYNATPSGHVGLQIPGYTPLDGASSGGAYTRLALTGLASTAGYRTNLALFTLAGTTGKWATVHVYSARGTDLKDLPVMVDVTGFTQVSNATLFGGIPGDLSRLSIVIDNIDAGMTVGAYATIIDNVSGDSTFVKATPAP